MLQPVIKTLSLSLIVLLAASNAPASEFGRPASSPRSQSEIDRGWAEQQQRFEERIAARPLDSQEIPGAIISPPFPGFEMKRAAEVRVGEAATAPSAERGGRGHGRSGPRR